jgi:hypothetical protein
LAATPLLGCQIVGGADYRDIRSNSSVYAEWNSNGTTFLTECRTDRQQIEAPPREALVSSANNKQPISKRNYNRADFYVCPELAEVTQ